MTLPIRGHVSRALLALPLLCLPTAVLASGFALEMQGARALGFSGAYVAQTNDPSSIHYNAAAIAFLKGKRFYVGGIYGGLSTDFTGSGPYPPKDKLEASQQALGVLPSAYYSQRVGEKTTFGIGIDQPFAFKNDWQGVGQATGRFWCRTCEVRSWSVNPTVAFRLADRFAVGGGVDVRLSKLSLTRRVTDSSASPKDIADQTVETSTTPAVSWNLGVLAQPSEQVSIGLAYRHRVTVTHDAQATFTQVLTGDKAFDDAVASALPKGQIAEVDFSYPATIAGGIAWRGERVTVEGDLVRTLWSSFDNVKLSFRSSTYDTALPVTFDAAWTLALGAEYAVRDDVAIRGGYSYETSPQPADTLSPFLNDASRMGFSAGASYTTETLRLDAGVRLVIFGGRATDGRNRYSYEGTYQTNKSLVAGISLGYRF